MSISDATVSLETVRVTRTSDRTARLTLDRPERRNALNFQVADDFAAAVVIIQEWGTPLAVLDAEGPAFCAGADLADLSAGGAALEEILEILGSAPIHWTARVAGAVRGGGLSILAACPAVFATPESTFGLPEITRGFFPASVLPGQAARVGVRRAFSLAFAGSPISAEVAYEWGLVSTVIDTDNLDEHINAELARMGALQPEAIREGVREWQALLMANLPR